MIGFDCEWDSTSGNAAETGSAAGGSVDDDAIDAASTTTGKVSVLQISTTSGLCIIVRLLKLIANSKSLEDDDETSQKRIPKTLRSVLKDESIVKLGVGLKEDSTRLWK